MPRLRMTENILQPMLTNLYTQSGRTLADRGVSMANTQRAGMADVTLSPLITATYSVLEMLGSTDL